MGVFKTLLSGGAGGFRHREESEWVSPDGRRTAAIAAVVLWALLRIATRAE
jgi:hypothetical protein